MPGVKSRFEEIQNGKFAVVIAIMCGPDWRNADAL
jgi:hypothetical protein